MKIVFTGGHHTSSLVIAKNLKAKGHEVIWFGHRQTMWQEPSLSLEYEEVTESGIPFVEIKAGKLYRDFNILKLLRIPYGFIEAFFKLLKEKPDFIVAFGGYLSLPVVIGAWLFGIPSVTHEQTHTYGLANKLISPFVKKVFLTWEESRKYFPYKKTEVVGLPLREEILKIKRIKKNQTMPLIYITGGKQGSHIINKVVEKILPELLEKYLIYHQSGKIVKTGDLASLQRKRNILNQEVKKNYYIRPFFNAKEVAKIFSSCSLVISRSGAHTVYELAFLGIPAIFIPIPWSFQNEQEKNALVFKKNQAGIILKEKKLTPENLLMAINKALKKSFSRNAKKLKSIVKTNATLKIVESLENLFNAQKKL